MQWSELQDLPEGVSPMYSSFHFTLTLELMLHKHVHGSVMALLFTHLRSLIPPSLKEQKEFHTPILLSCQVLSQSQKSHQGLWYVLVQSLPPCLCGVRVEKAGNELPPAVSSFTMSFSTHLYSQMYCFFSFFNPRALIRDVTICGSAHMRASGQKGCKSHFILQKPYGTRHCYHLAEMFTGSLGLA